MNRLRDQCDHISENVRKIKSVHRAKLMENKTLGVSGDVKKLNRFIFN